MVNITDIQSSIYKLETNMKDIMAEIKNLKKLLEQQQELQVLSNQQNQQAQEVLDVKEQRSQIEKELRQNIESFITFPLPTETSFKELNFDDRLVKQSINLIDDVEDLLDKTFSREDSYEYMHLSELQNFLRALVNKNVHSKYQVKELYEDGLHIDSPTKVIQDHNEREEILKLMPNPYYARVDINDYETKLKSTYYIGVQGFDGKGKEDLKIINWKTEIGEIFEKKEKYFNQIHTLKKFGEFKLTFARNIEINDGQIIKLHTPIGQTELNEALIQRLASKHGIDMDIIVETIDGEQSDIIRMPIKENEVIIVQGSAGSGKSAIALQRISFILAEYKNEIKSEDSVAFFGPNTLFLKHVEKVLPRLGTYKVIQTTLDSYLGGLVGLASVSKVIMHESQVAKTTIEYKDWIEQTTNKLLNNLKIWNADLIVSDGGKLPALKVMQVAEESFKLPYKQRKNYIVQNIDKILKTKRSFEDSFISTIQNRLEDFIFEELNKVIAKFPKDISEVDKIISKETLATLNLFTRKVLSDKRRNSKHELFYSAVTNDAKEITKNLTPLLKQDYKRVISKFNEHMRDLRFIFSEQVKVLIDEHIQTALEEKCKEFISSRISQHIDISYSNLAVTLESLLKQEEIQELNQNAITEFDKYYRAKYEQELLQSYLSVLNSFDQTWKFEFEQRLNRVVREIYLKHKVAIPTGVSNFQKPNVNYKKNTKQIVADLEEINRYVSSKMYADEAQILREIFLLYKQATPFPQLKLEESFSRLDLPALFTIHLIINGGNNKKLDYLIVDEAQDYTPYDLWCLTHLTKRNSFMLLGDLAQKIQPYNPNHSWIDYQTILGNISFYNLKKTYRSTKQIVEYTNQLIEPYARGKFELPSTIYREGPTVKQKFAKDVLAEVMNYIHYLWAVDDTYQTIAIVCKNYREAEEMYRKLKNNVDEVEWQKTIDESIHSSIVVIEAALAKGLEFDCVIIPDLSKYENTELDRKLAYVAASRALHELCVAYSGDVYIY